MWVFATIYFLKWLIIWSSSSIYLEISASCQHRELNAALSQQAKDEKIDVACLAEEHGL